MLSCAVCAETGIRRHMRKLFAKLEKKCSRFAIKHLMNYIIVIYIIGLFISWMYPEVYTKYLALDAAMILRGEVWRIFSFLLISPTNSPFFAIFSLYLYYILGRTLENVWGPFRFNIYYFSGVLFTVLAAIIIYKVTGVSYTGISTYYINMSLFLAFATVIPDMQLLFMFLIPIKMKYLAYLDVAFLLYEIVIGNGATRISIVVSLMNFILYFFVFMRDKNITAKNVFRRMEYQRKAESGRYAAPESGPAPVHHTVITRHRCAVCGKTELTDPDMEFRFCSKCRGDYEYCSDHIKDHMHVV